jgi:membrane associated rhomboid family serine protease
MKVSLRSILAEVKTQVTLLVSLTVVLWTIEIIDWLAFRGSLDRYGIWPRHLIGLRGIMLAPFLHGSFQHLVANTPPLLVLSWLIMAQEIRDWLRVTLISAGVAGIGTWLVGAGTSIHIGASGIIFGYIGYLMAQGYFERRLLTVSLSILAVGLYGSFLWGILPGQPGISWESHLFGFLGGILAARWWWH